MKDQSNYSLLSQQNDNRYYAERYGIQIIKTFIDNGQSAKTFERKEWKQLEAELYKSRKEIDYLIVANYDRLIRNVMRGLMMIEKIEETWGITVASSRQDYGIHPSHPNYFSDRARNLLRAEDELRTLQYRTKRGIRQGRELGYYMNKAPFGYTNVKDENKKTVLVQDPDKIEVIAYIIDAWNMGIEEAVIKKEARKRGFTLTGNDRIKRTVSNLVYYGLIHVPKFGDQKEFIHSGLHKGIRTRREYERAKIRLNDSEQTHKVTLRDDLPLRGIVRCYNCSKKMTGSHSKGKLRRILYYRCQHCKRQNHNALRAHDWLTEILTELSIPPLYMDQLNVMIDAKYDSFLETKNVEKTELQRQYNKSNKNLINVEQKFIEDKINQDTFNRWNTTYTKEIDDYSNRIAEVDRILSSDRVQLKAFSQHFSNLNYAYDRFDTATKQSFLSLVFDNNLYLTKEGYRTLYKPIVMFNKDLKTNRLEIEKGKSIDKNSTNFPFAARRGIEPLLPG